MYICSLINNSQFHSFLKSLSLCIYHYIDLPVVFHLVLKVPCPELADTNIQMWVRYTVPRIHSILCIYMTQL